MNFDPSEFDSSDEHIELDPDEMDLLLDSENLDPDEYDEQGSWATKDDAESRLFMWEDLNQVNEDDIPY